jgi:hypothetical protein
MMEKLYYPKIKELLFHYCRAILLDEGLLFPFRFLPHQMKKPVTGKLAQIRLAIRR